MLHFLFLSSFPTYLKVTQTCHLDLKYIYTTIRRREEIIFLVFSTQAFLRFFESQGGGGTKEINMKSSLLEKKSLEKSDGKRIYYFIWPNEENVIHNFMRTNTSNSQVKK